MISVENQTNRVGAIEVELRGLSTDQKPTGTYRGANIANGSIFLEMDTQKICFYDAASSTWVGGDE